MDYLWIYLAATAGFAVGFLTSSVLHTGSKGE